MTLATTRWVGSLSLMAALGMPGIALAEYPEQRRSQVPSATLLKDARTFDRFLEHLGVDFQWRSPVQGFARPRVQ